MLSLAHLHYHWIPYFKNVFYIKKCFSTFYCGPGKALVLDSGQLQFTPWALIETPTYVWVSLSHVWLPC